MPNGEACRLTFIAAELKPLQQLKIERTLISAAETPVLL